MTESAAPETAAGPGAPVRPRGGLAIIFTALMLAILLAAQGEDARPTIYLARFRRWQAAR